MADLTNGSTNPTPPQEPSMEKRLLLAFLLMGAVLLLTPYFYKKFIPQPAATARPPVAQTQRAAASAPETPAVANAAAPAGPLAAQKPEEFVVDTNLYRVVLSNQGGVVKSWLLKKYRDNAGKELNLVNAAGSAKAGFPFSLTFKSKKPAYDANNVLYAVKASADGMGVDYEYSDGDTTIRKSFRFEKNRYLSTFASEATQNGAGIPHLVQWRGGFGDAAVQNASGAQRSVHFDISSGKLVVNSAKDAKDGPVTSYGSYSFAGMEDTFFAAVFLPRDDAQTEFTTYSDTVPGAADAKEVPHAGAAVGGRTANTFQVFVGPKDLDVLKAIDPRLEQMVDFGRWFGFIAKPLFLVVNWISEHITHNYGWAIVLVTILINTALLPMKLSSMKSMKKMQSLKPQIDAINAKYKNVGMRDPRAAEKNAEIMDLYKKNGVNPLGAGCLPLLIQLPFFYAFYTVLTVAIEMRGANWLWVSDLSQPEHLPIHILPVLMTIAQFVMQKMTPNPSADPNQQRMMMLMPLFFAFLFYNMSSGLVLYWLTSNLVGIVQQYFINRSMPLPPAPAPAAVVSKPRRSR
jgi:YidC/Oxa1 family membrane protein insertase